MKSMFKTVGILIMTTGVHLGEFFWIGLALVLIGGVSYFLADLYDDHCPCVCDEEEAEWID